MAIRSNADLDFVLRDAGVPVVSALSSTFGILRNVDTVEQTDGASFQKRGTVVIVRTGTIIDLAIELPLTVNGGAYVARWFDLQDDGALTKILLAEVTS